MVSRGTTQLVPHVVLTVSWQAMPLLEQQSVTVLYCHRVNLTSYPPPTPTHTPPLTAVGGRSRGWHGVDGLREPSRGPGGRDDGRLQHPWGPDLHTYHSQGEYSQTRLPYMAKQHKSRDIKFSYTNASHIMLYIYVYINGSIICIQQIIYVYKQ